MVEPDIGDTSSRFDVVPTDHGYELWIADRIAVFNDQNELKRQIELLKAQAASIGLQGRR